MTPRKGDHLVENPTAESPTPVVRGHKGGKRAQDAARLGQGPGGFEDLPGKPTGLERTTHILVAKL
jgi:hypothetical protein